MFSCSENSAPPDYIQGKWTTDDPKYNDRYIVITERLLTIGLGNGTESVNTITGVTSRESDVRTEYRISYRDNEGEEWTLTLYYAATDHGTMQIKNSNSLWRKDVTND
jgi:hypothetical protein